MDKAKIIFDQLAFKGLVGWHQAFDNLSCFTHPKNFVERINSLLGIISDRMVILTTQQKESIIKFLTWLAIGLNDSYELKLNLQNRNRHKEKILTTEDLQKCIKSLLELLHKFENPDKNLVSKVLESEKLRLSKIMSTGRGKSLFTDKASYADTTSVENWIIYWSEFGKNSNLRKLRENTKYLIGVDYGLGVFEARILWGANLVMMNPTLAKLALAEDEDLKILINELKSKFGYQSTREELVREATKIAGLKARLSTRAIFLLTGFGKVSFQVNPRTYNQLEKLEEDLRRLYKEFNEEALEYDSELFLDEVLTEQEITNRKGQTHVFFKIDGSNKHIYGNIEKVLLEQIRSGKFDIIDNDTGGIIEKILSDGMNCNVTVAGFITDGLYSFFCQIRGHAKARKKNIPVSHSIITKMGGRVESALRWTALQKLSNLLKQKNNPEAEKIATTDHIKIGTLDAPWIRELAKESGLTLPEEINPAEYKNYKGKLFPQDIAICTIAEAISKRSNEIITALKHHPILKEQSVEEWETGDLQAAMRPPYAGRFPHVEELVGIYAQGHFPDIALAIENWQDFKPNPSNINKPVNPVIIEQLYNSIIGDEFAQVYEVDDTLKKVLIFFGIYKSEYGDRGIKIDQLARHPFSQQTLFGKVVGDNIPATEEEKDKIRTGFVGDFNLLAEELKSL